MMRISTLIARPGGLLLAILALGGVPACRDQPAPAPPAVVRGEPLVPLTIERASGTVRFRVEVARTDRQQARGLMGRTSLPPDGGMLFPFVTPAPAAFWMKDTAIPLDMIFIRPDGTIARIAAETAPYSLETVSSGEPVIAVLEIAGGRAEALGIREGDRVRWTLDG